MTVYTAADHVYHRLTQNLLHHHTGGKRALLETLGQHPKNKSIVNNKWTNKFVVVNLCKWDRVFVQTWVRERRVEQGKMGSGHAWNYRPCFILEPTEISKQPVRTRYLGHVTGYRPVRDQYSLIRSVPGFTHGPVTESSLDQQLREIIEQGENDNGSSEHTRFLFFKRPPPPPPADKKGPLIESCCKIPPPTQPRLSDFCVTGNEISRLLFTVPRGERGQNEVISPSPSPPNLSLEISICQALLPHITNFPIVPLFMSDDTLNPSPAPGYSDVSAEKLGIFTVPGFYACMTLKHMCMILSFLLSAD
eukprot:sb/3467211/